MGREQYKTPELDVAAEFERVCQLFRLALGKPSDRLLFDAMMGEASAQGMTWVEGLEYVIEQRLAARDVGLGGPIRKPPARAMGEAGIATGELLRVG